ncbi:MAG: 2-C-methyl-D-erythritol 2,4-cyclodiphosphate synthase [Phycisphaeraceae bacterium]|nr:2-C-methyl-D-erythritol 2,4-cyclodiphosphate synthase [Phycisphaerales bacterium]MCB9860116.1 2-C-methyl-D-erythritol 2,4-cyclodiphosphate synthase [Phycisphaeraceae bacterium]
MGQSETSTRFRIGHGYDLHRLVPVSDPAGGGKPLILGGIEISQEISPVAHSDGDALLHAITDALLGAIAGSDLGSLFPNTASENRDRPSVDFLVEALRRAADCNMRVANIDATIILESPKIGPMRDQIRAKLASMMSLEVHQVNVKGKTHEGLDSLGRREAVEVHVVVLMAYNAS